MNELKKYTPAEFIPDELSPYLGHIEIKEQNEGPFALIGVILYAEKTKLAVVAHDMLGNLKCAYIGETEFKKEDVDVSQTRVLELAKYQEIRIAHMNFGEMRIETSDSFRQTDSVVHAQITLTSPQNGEKGRLNLDEIEMLKFVIGEKGGIAPFYEAGLSDEYGFVFEKSNTQNLNATIAFAHPENISFKLESLEGVRVFMSSLNREMLKKASIKPEIRNLIAKIDNEVSSGRVKEGAARIETLKAQIIAYSRLSEISGASNQRYESELNKIIAQLQPKRHALANLLDGPLRLQHFSQVVEAAAFKLMLTDDDSKKHLEPENTVKPEATVDNKIVLKTQRAVEIFNYYHNYLGENFGTSKDNFTKQAMESYLQQIIKLIRNSLEVENGKIIGTVEDFEDADSLVNDLLKTPYGKAAIINALSRYSYDYLDYGYLKKGEDQYYVSTILTKMQDFIATGRTKALDNRFELTKRT